MNQKQQLGPDHPDIANSLSALAERYRAQGKYAEAEPLRKAKYRASQYRVSNLARYQVQSHLPHSLSLPQPQT
jgi:hypothetical protein